MKRRLAPALSRFPVPAVLIAGLTVAMFLAGVLKHMLESGTPDLQGFLGLVGIITFLVFPLMGLVLVRHQPSNAVGYLLLGIGLGIFVIFNSAGFANGLAPYQPLLPVSQLFAFLTGTGWIPFLLMLLLFLPMLFPDGRLLSRRWWLPIVSGLIFAILALFGNLFTVTHAAPGESAVTNPLANASLAKAFAPLANLAVPFALLALVGSVSSVVVRYRRGDSLQRHQLRWFLCALLLASVPFFLHEVNQTLSNLALLLFVPLLPISIAIAMLRYRLYDIDVVINRALVYGALAAFITAVYVAIVVGIGRLVGSGNRPNLALSIVATAVVAVAFQPVRERVERFANRLVYGKRATPYQVMAGFADRMAGTLSVDDVLPQMAEAASRGVGAQAARVTLFLRDGSERSTAWPPDASGEFARTLPISYGGERVGEIAVRESPGQPITPGETRLLTDLAAQAGLVLHNVRLTVELQARLADISAQAAELRASRQRIVTAQETERRRLGSEIRAGVQRELEATSQQLDEVERLLGDDGAAAAERLEALTTETQSTLDGLRELARGIFPPLLADKGIVAALQAHARKAAVHASIESPAELGGTRFDPGVEAAVYFCCTEALRAADGPATVHLMAGAGVLTFAIDGVAALDGRLEGLRDRVEALGGTLARSAAGIAGSIPVRAEAGVA